MSRIETVEVGGTEYTLGVDKDSTVTFTEAQTRTNIASGESLATMFGKIKKFFTDLKTVAFTGNVADMSDVTITSPASGDTLFHNGTGWENKNLMVEVTKAEYDALVANNEDDPNVDYHITDIDVAEAYYVETSGQTAITGATSLTFTNSHITPTSDIRILAEPASCKVASNPQYKVSAKLSSVGSGTATITFPALTENTEFWLLIECPLSVIQFQQAEDVEYDNSTSGLTSNNVQDAIDELDAGNVVTRFEVTVHDWNSDTTSQSGTTLYKKQILVTNIYVDCPTVDIGQPITVPLPTVANQKAYNLLQYVTVDKTVPCLYLYASAIPTNAFYISVKGVD